MSHSDERSTVENFTVGKMPEGKDWVVPIVYQRSINGEYDEREGKPSASNFARYAACPGSWNLSKHAPPQEEYPWTKDGTIVHDLLAVVDRPDATDEHRETAERCREIEQKARETIGVPPIAAKWREQRWWDSHGRFSGKADLTVAWHDGFGDKLWIHDHKTGRADVDPAPTNHQLCALVAAAATSDIGCEIFVSIGGPFHKLTIARYGPEEIEQAKRESEEIVKRLTTHAHVLNAGYHCRYCPAKSICPESQGEALQAPAALTCDLSTATKYDIATAAKSLSDCQLESLMANYRVRQWANEAIYAETKRRLKAGAVMESWKLEPGDVREKITDPMAVYARMQEWCSPEEFCKAATVSKKSLETLVRSGLKLKGKAATDKVKELVAGLTEETQCDPSIVENRKELNESAE